MSKKFAEYKNFDLSQINKEINELWKKEETFERSLSSREGNPSFVFYEGPPSANGVPGIHHVMARAIKDIFCRYKTQTGFHVKRKAGWDTHGLPVELSVEKAKNITKEDIGKKISIEDYNKACREDVMKYTDVWEDLTEKMGYWIDMSDPYITYDNKYIETLWYLLENDEENFLYKGYTIQPYSPAAGTGLSTHELNQPGCYKDVKDTTVVAQFKVLQDETSAFLFNETKTPIYILAWTTTPWTLPSNTALTIGKKIEYSLIETYNQYTGDKIAVIVASDLAPNYFAAKNAELAFDEYKAGDKHIPFKQLKTFKGSELLDINYEQLLNWVKPEGKAFKVIAGDFVTTDEGTGVVHTAPTFGADDYRVSAENKISAIHLKDKNGFTNPLVDKKGRFFRLEDLDPDFVKMQINTDSYSEFAGKFVKNEYDPSKQEGDTTTDIDIAVFLKQNNLAFKIEKYVHNYPHCWRTDKPVLYYPLDSWFIRTTAMKDRMMELNNTIKWKPEATGSGRFGKWLENLVDWNLSRSRFWGTPLPIWLSEDGSENICIGSIGELKAEIEKAVSVGFMDENPLSEFIEGDFSKENYDKFDLHRPFVDDIVLVSASGKKMFREPDLIDVWFDSGAMPYAQKHYPFEISDEEFKEYYPANFIAEGVDQTRGWFFTLHAISTMLFDSVSFKNIISNGLVLDKAGNKMSKRLGNGVDPFETIDKYGSDPLRWYMITNAQPWDNIKFDINGVEEVRRKFFGTLYNTYSFFSLYANVDKFTYQKEEVPVKQRPEIDRWIISLLHSLVKEVQEQYENYEPTRAARLIQDFVLENLSNWYVRLNRKRYWGGEFNTDKLAAYQTLYTCLETVAQLAAPVAPFYMEKLFRDLNSVSAKHTEPSVHLVEFPTYDEALIDQSLEERMTIAQSVTSMVLGLRRKVNIKVRQPLNRIMIPVLDLNFQNKLEGVKDLILNEVNVKSLEYLKETEGVLVKKIKPDFKALGPKYGKMMKQVAAAVNAMDQKDISSIEANGVFKLSLGEETVDISVEDVEISSEDIPGWLVANEGTITVALDITISEELRLEGIARELVNRIQNIRKESDFDVTDKVNIIIEKHQSLEETIAKFGNYICAQTLAESISLETEIDNNQSRNIELDEEITIKIMVTKTGN